MLDKLTLGLRTDLMMLKPFGRLTPHFDCLQFVSPAMPDYFFGNCLIFPKPPVAGDFPRWTSRFETLFADMSGIRHQTLLWPSHAFDPSGILPFTKAGFELDATAVMASAHPKAHRPLEAGIALRKVTSDADWQAASHLQISVGLEDMEYAGYSDFERRRMVVLRRWAEAGNGGWFGAFEGSKLIGSLGLYVEKGIARYQAVGTHKEYRGRGIAGALLAFAAHSIAEQHKVDQFVIIADQDSTAHRLYLKSGFEFHSAEHSLMRAPQSAPD
ncbi:GNAT family N-acetyltransferase [Rhodobacteraceae bacterium]|nr:GNAT family N-acetyltransferase [Paracoccaceae bacterium]